MGNSSADILSKLYVAEKKKKKLTVFSFSNCNIDLLNFLWKDGFIYGYSRADGGKITVFLKYFHSGGGFFSNLIFLKKQKVSLQGLKNLSVLDKNSYYLVQTSKGILSANYCVKIGIGGYLIARF